MTDQISLLRRKLAIVGFVGGYVPVIVVLIVVLATSSDVWEERTETGTIVVTSAPAGGTGVSVWVFTTVIALAPLVAWLAWRWSGRAVQPLVEAVQVQLQLIEEASHEMRTPLATLSANADVLLRHSHPTIELYRDGLERSGATARRMSAMLEAILADARSRARSVDRRTTDLGELVRAVVDDLRPLAAASGVTIESTAGARVEARVDRLGVQHAVANLITNAIEHSPVGEPVTVTVSVEDDVASVEVADRGPGIAPDERQRVFDRYRKHEGGAGMGIGLAIVRQVALAHGGDAAVRSPVDGQQGTCFVLTVRT